MQSHDIPVPIAFEPGGVPIRHIVNLLGRQELDEMVRVPFCPADNFNDVMRRGQAYHVAATMTTMPARKMYNVFSLGRIRYRVVSPSAC